MIIWILVAQDISATILWAFKLCFYDGKEKQKIREDKKYLGETVDEYLQIKQIEKIN